MIEVQGTKSPSCFSSEKKYEKIEPRGIISWGKISESTFSSLGIEETMSDEPTPQAKAQSSSF